MPIYEETYRPWHGQLNPNPRSWLIIARTGVRLLWKRAMILTLLLASFTFLVRALQVYAATRLGDYPQLADIANELTIDSGIFAGFLEGQGFFVFLILIIAGAGQIANDRRYKALSIYFARPVFFLDNEPTHVNLFRDRFPDALVVWMETDHSPRKEQPHLDIPVLRSFLVSG